MWVEISVLQMLWSMMQSSSSWGCELKYGCRVQCKIWCCHPLREDVSWNTVLCWSYWKIIRHPLREDVSWNTLWHSVSNWLTSHPLREDVSWNGIDAELLIDHACHPLREDVSWNTTLIPVHCSKICHPLREDVSWNGIQNKQNLDRKESSSSWGCELK